MRSVRVPPGARRAIHAPGKGVPPPPGDSRHRRQRCRGVPPPAHSLSACFQATGLPTSPSVTASSQHLLLGHCQLVEYNLLVLTSAADPIKNICLLDHRRCDQLARHSWRRRRARHALPGKACRHPAMCAGLGVASSPTECRLCHRSSRAKRAGAAVGRGAPSMHPGRECRRHRATRGAAANAAVVCRCRRTVDSVTASMKHHLQLHCQLVECNLLVRTSAADPIMDMIELDHSRCNQLARCSWSCRRARRALPGKACRHHPAWRAAEARHRRQPGKACRCSRREERAGAAVR